MRLLTHLYESKKILSASVDVSVSRGDTNLAEADVSSELFSEILIKNKHRQT